MLRALWFGDYFGLPVDIFDSIVWNVPILACLISTCLHSLLIVVYEWDLIVCVCVCVCVCLCVCVLILRLKK